MGGVGKAVGDIIKPIADIAAGILTPVAEAAGKVVAPVLSGGQQSQQQVTPTPAVGSQPEKSQVNQDRKKKLTLVKKAAAAAASKAPGRTSTILTSPLGASGEAPVKKKTLLGG